MRILRELYEEISYVVTYENDNLCFYMETGRDHLLEGEFLEEFLNYKTTLPEFNRKFMVAFNSIEEFGKGLNSLSDSEFKDFLFHLIPTPSEFETLCFLLIPVQKMQGYLYREEIEFDTSVLDGEVINQSTVISHKDSLIFFTIGHINMWDELVLSTYGFDSTFLKIFFQTNKALDIKFLEYINPTVLSQKINDYYFDYDIDNRPELSRKLNAYLRKRKINKLLS